MAKAKRNTSKTAQNAGLPKESEVAKVDATANGEAKASPEPEAKPTKQAAPAPKKQWIVVKSFRDRDNYDKIHAEGADVSHLEPSRLDYLKQIGYVK